MAKSLSAIVLFLLSFVSFFSYSDTSFYSENRRFTLSSGSVPAIHSRQYAKQSRLIIYLHGFSSNKEAGLNEIEKLAAAGFDVLAIDAPHHGERKSASLDRAINSAESDRIKFVMQVVRAQQKEISEMISRVESEGYSEFTIAGVSMGALTAYGVAAHDARVSAIVPILGSPYWERFSEYDQIAGKNDSPWVHVQNFKNVKIFAVNAEKDKLIPAVYSKAFILKLQETYQTRAHQFIYREIENATHFLNQDQWDKVLESILKWLEESK